MPESVARIVRICGPLLIGVMGAAIRLWPPDQAGIVRWAVAFIVVGAVSFVAAVAEEVIAWRKRRVREREQDEHNREVRACLKSLETQAAQANVPALSRELTALREAVLPKVAIRSPVNDQQVSFRQTVNGSIWPPDTPVQALVFAGDKRWHPQPTKVNGTSWTATCQFGDEESKARRGEYQIMAVAGPRIAAATESLPDDIARSKAIRVVREAT